MYKGTIEGSAIEIELFADHENQGPSQLVVTYGGGSEPLSEDGLLIQAGEKSENTIQLGEAELVRVRVDASSPNDRCWLVVSVASAPLDKSNGLITGDIDWSYDVRRPPPP